MPLASRADCGDAKYAGVDVAFSCDIVDTLQVSRRETPRMQALTICPPQPSFRPSSHVSYYAARNDTYIYPLNHYIVESSSPDVTVVPALRFRLRSGTPSTSPLQAAVSRGSALRRASAALHALRPPAHLLAMEWSGAIKRQGHQVTSPSIQAQALGYRTFHKNLSSLPLL